MGTDLVRVTGTTYFPYKSNGTGMELKLGSLSRTLSPPCLHRFLQWQGQNYYLAFRLVTLGRGEQISWDTA